MALRKTAAWKSIRGGWSGPGRDAVARLQAAQNLTGGSDIGVYGRGPYGTATYAGGTGTYGAAHYGTGKYGPKTATRTRSRYGLSFYGKGRYGGNDRL